MNDAITIDDIHKQLGKREILKDISFTVAPGDIFGYLGPNGAGKTTTMRVILGLLRSTSGRALVQGKDLAEDTAARGRVGVLLERDGLYDRLSAYDNLNYYAQLYGIKERQSKIERLLEFAGLSERKKDKVGEFSKGMKRKLGLARAIIHEPEVLFLDEPSAGLDPEAQKMARDLLLQLSREKNMTIFLNSHDLDEVQRICSKVAIIQRGSIRVCDTLENLTNKSEATTVQITLSDNNHANKARGLIDTLDYAASLEQKEPATIMATLSKESKPSDLLTSLISSGIKVEEIKSVTQSLEDIYLEITRQEENDG
ncbi:MAG: ABC transporter ATP-binding protein [Dehalococcoidales bacterium]|nr:ABC transporter ATP-binding protein [Dehalococcoidales bacterium]